MHGGIEKEARRNSRQLSPSSQRRMQPTYPKTKQTALRPFLLSKIASEAGKY